MQSTKKSGIQGKVKRIIETELCQSVLLNLLVLIVLLLLFEPTDKPDDFDMSMILYGAYNGKYSSISVVFQSDLWENSWCFCYNGFLCRGTGLCILWGCSCHL